MKKVKNRAIMLWLIICCAALLTAKCEGIINAALIVTFAKQFRAPKPFTLFHDVPKEGRIEFIKSMSKVGFTLDWINELENSKKFLLVISQDDRLLARNKEIKIDQQIYFLTPSLDLYEKYTINNVLIQQKLGHFVDGMYIPEESIEQNFMKRRQKFHGSKLIALAGTCGIHMKIENLKNAQYFPSNETYDVTDFVQGPIFDIWTTLQTNLNFTTRIYSRKDDKMGVPIQHPNGSTSVPDGTIKDIMNGSGDVVLTCLTIMYNRYLVIDYLAPLDRYPVGIYVSKDSIQESFDFDVFSTPFDKWTWTTLISSSLIVTISIVLTSKVLNEANLNFLNFMDVFAKSLQANLGNASFTPIANKFHSLHMVVFVTLMMGNIIWIAYNGALLSKLVQPRFDKPFHDLESLAESNYR